ncbi:ArnT family glycosyltransferase [Spelaeicoccus albus]|uniref:4-amino-4-deoxy-L-arabinose transferase-like glycosyltransferase n=1 Tax=Spelaeicoccus albus TaxID=1280376 RepID=A0A7Z0D5K9_9MICO|nr:glycosyltransferase family 39 protein [Spelaeicoccus albus]NYI69330.1 4-amino-4-deoxy-L-arabinose transferase-like glycosyltransferase [Spelaeicoccus albus]
MTTATSAPARRRTASRKFRWDSPALLVLLAGTAALYLVGRSASGWANSFYSAAVQAGSESWKAFFFGASDAAGSITVDKPPASLWVMALSVRAFGLSSWSILVPQALMGVATVGVLYASVRRTAIRRLGRAAASCAGLLAGLVLALTPVAALMFRFNNPDALLVLLMTGATALTLRAVRTGRARWILLAGVLIGFGFLTKQLQVFLILPALVAVYAACAPHGWWARIRHLLGAAAAIVVSAGWWVAAVQLTPASDRPYIGGSQHNSILELTFGYNGFGRLTGNETGSVGGGGTGGAGGMWGTPGIGRLFGSEMGGQISWLLPAALAVLAAGLVVLGRARRTDVYRAALIAWGLWLVVTGLTFSLMSGIIHPYYMVALAPALAAVVGLGTVLLWRNRSRGWVMTVLAPATAGTAVWEFVLLGRTPDWYPWLRIVILVGGIAAAILLELIATLRRLRNGASMRRRERLAASLALVTALAGPFAYTLQTASTGHSGSIVSAGPTATGFGGGPGGGPAGGGAPGTAGGKRGAIGQPPGGPGNGAPQQGSQQRGPGQSPPHGTPPAMAQGSRGSQGSTQGGMRGGPGRGNAAGAGNGSGGGLLNGSTPGKKLTQLLDADSGDYTWVAATIGANSAAGYQLATELPVMPIGGFNGTDPSPTLAEFKADVAAGKIHYFIAGGGMGGGQSTGPSSRITSWVKAHYSEQTVDGVSIFDLTK